MSRIVTLTLNPAIDKSASVDNVIAERKLRCSDPSFDPGGGGINVARVVAELGGKTTAVYPAGGFTGRMLSHLLEDAGLDHRSVSVSAMTRENFSVFESSTDQQYRFNFPGARLTQGELDACFDAAMEAAEDIVVFSGSLPPGVAPSVVADLADRCRSAGYRFVADTSGDALCEAVEAGVFLVKPNLHELEALAGRELESEDERMAAARNIVSDGGAACVVVSLGAAGVFWIDSNGKHEHLRAPTVRVRSKVGAGDSTVGGIVYGMAEGWSMRDSIRYGVAAGAAAVMSDGTGLCSRDDVERLFHETMGGREA